MSKLKELIDRLCPDGVEFLPLKNIAVIKNGKDYKHCGPGDIPVYGSGGIMTYIDHFCYDKPTVLLPRKGSIGKIYYIETPFWNVDTVYYTDINTTKICPKFLYYFLSTIDLEKMNCGKGAVPSLTQEILYRITIPVPPIEVQEEIVKILDRFADYAAELQAELQARKEQYEYYRNLLLTFNPSACGCGTDGEQEIKVTTWGGHSYEITWKTMGEICRNICSGGTPLTTNKSYYNGNIPWLRTQEVDWKEVYDTAIKITEDAIKNSSAKLVPANCVIIAMYGATAAKCCINKIPLTTNQACCNLEIDAAIADYRYVYHWICKEYTTLKALGEGSQSNISGAKIKNYRIPIPPIELQEKIVAILDRFETLVNDLTEGLPAEIAAVKERYEYYRNRLLTFKRIA
ncbi:MAG: restriction endonuclease subunit S [Muribaculaceae bacterium]|nr:restriction endonuclease subunit S [Muribaculaceae bacterium]